MVGLCEGVLEYASNAEAWPAHMPASLHVTRISLRIIVSQQTSFSPFLDLTIDPTL